MERVKLTQHSQRNLNVIENFIDYFSSNEDERERMKQVAYDYVLEDHVDGEDSEEAAEEKSQERIKEFKKYELLGEEIFLSGDDNEENPIDLYCDSNESPTLFAVPRNPYKPVRKFRLTKPQSIIEVHHRWEILNYCLGTPTAEDEVSLKDIFMHAKYVEEIL